MPLPVVNAQLAVTAAIRPSITVWSRLEMLPATPDYAPALAAEVADPLWLLARQWQFGEFEGEDAGSPIDVRLSARETPLQRFHPGPLKPNATAAAVDYDAQRLPLEPIVEAEDPRLAGLVEGLRSGRHFLRMLDAAKVPDTFSALPGLQGALPGDTEADLDRDGDHWLALFANRSMIDGHLLADAIARTGGLPAEATVAAEHEDTARTVCLGWLDWYRGSLGPMPASSWVAGRLEYGFAVAARTDAAEVVLDAAEYTDGRLDWYQFDAASAPSLGTVPSRTRSIPFSPMLPSPARFGGMPADRFWEFEDGRVNLSQVKAGPTDLGRLLLLEFALAYGNDWYVVPVDLPVGSLFAVDSFTVRDTFGVISQVRHASAADRNPWRMFELSGGATNAPGPFLLAPTIAARLEGDPVEEVALFRDEMANMAWAVERKVQGKSGVPVDRYREAALAAQSQRFADLSHVTAELVYRVATPVPEHWLPLVPVPRAGQANAGEGIILERRAMLRREADGTQTPVMPRGVLLRTDLSLSPEAEPRMRIEDEEVPREGAVITRTVQFARWVNGERLIWTGRRKAVGKGEGASGLRYDIRQRKSDIAPGGN